MTRPSFLCLLLLLLPNAVDAVQFTRGEIDGNAPIDLTDGVVLLNYLFLSTETLPCDDAADTNDDGRINLTDSVFLLNFLFLGGPRPAPPFEFCGHDCTEDELACAAFSACQDPVLAPPFEFGDTDADGNYRPFLATGELVRPRYGHEAVTTRSGRVCVVGGTDERGLTSIDTVEFFLPDRAPAGELPPGRAPGFWVDTDFEGDTVRLPSGRLYFTLTERTDGRLLCLGGTTNILGGPLHGEAVLIDPDARTVQALEQELVEPRFRHTTTVLPDGNWLIAGGQRSTTVVVDLEPIGLGQQVTVYPSTASIEIYSPEENTFELLAVQERLVELATRRGRAGHAATRIAGVDNRLGTDDDLVLLAGGLMTLSPQFAPANKLPGRVGNSTAEAVTTVELFDPNTRQITAMVAALPSGRIDAPHIVNLGEFNDSTPDGVLGMGNAVLITHGHSDEECLSTAEAMFDEVLVATFTGFGPAGGVQFASVRGPDERLVQGMEYANALTPTDTRLPDGALGTGGSWIGRSMTNPVALPRRIDSAAGVSTVGTWVITVGGTHAAGSEESCTHFPAAPQARAASLFDPYFSLGSLAAGGSPRNLEAARSLENPLGISGTWLVLDGSIPGESIDGFGSTPVGEWPQMLARARADSVNVPLPGNDGILGTPDDLLLLVGGATDPARFGGEPTCPSVEILVPPAK